MVTDFIRTELGKTLRIETSNDGGLRVDVLRKDVWVAAPLGMIGLRLSKGARPLTSHEIATLPA
jgi:hypothetical protein